jgi:hypothetical protein
MTLKVSVRKVSRRSYEACAAGPRYSVCRRGKTEKDALAELVKRLKEHKRLR